MRVEINQTADGACIEWAPRVSEANQVVRRPGGRGVRPDYDEAGDMVELDELGWSLRALVSRLGSFGVSLADAAHVAAAQIGGADYLVTNDHRLARRAAQADVARLLTVAVVNPHALPEKGIL